MKKYFLAVILLILPATSGLAQATGGIERLGIKSQVLNEERAILVSTPPNYQRNDTRYPVLYLTDASAQLPHTIATIDFLANNGRMMPMIIVGIVTTENRTRDLTPTKAGFRSGDERFPTSGGAPKFLEFIETELIPNIEKRYRASPWRAFAGHSFGGLFALYAFTAKPELFNAYIGVSPSFDWDDHFVSKRLEELCKTRKELNRALFFTLANEGGETKVGFERYRNTLKKSAPKGLIWDSMLMEDEDHGSVVMRSHYHAFRKVFEGLQPPQAAINGGLKGIEQHYQTLSSRFNYPVLPPEPLLNQLGYQLFGEGKKDEAITVFQTNVKHYPASANVYDSLAEALEKTGKLEEARANYEKAWQLGAQSKDPNTAVFKTNFERADAAIKKKASKN